MHYDVMHYEIVNCISTLIFEQLAVLSKLLLIRPLNTLLIFQRMVRWLNFESEGGGQAFVGKSSYHHS
jgi:hypothetical protein